MDLEQTKAAASLPTSGEFHMFTPNENVKEAVPNACIASATPITGANLQSNSHLANEAVLDLPSTSNGSLPRNFSLSDIADLDYLFDVQDNPEAQPFLDITIDDFDFGLSHLMTVGITKLFCVSALLSAPTVCMFVSRLIVFAAVQPSNRFTAQSVIYALFSVT
ncbi:hypothetical protein TSUD_330340 [Trifolium subterraneum]|nr:hypothetical protein TSUD_330340 [Trifolium subterraneum]